VCYAAVVVSNATQVGCNWSASWVWRHVSIYWWPCRLVIHKCIQVTYFFVCLLGCVLIIISIIVNITLSTMPTHIRLLTGNNEVVPRVGQW